jgi:hypothetical protein
MFRTTLCVLLLAAAPLVAVAQDELSEAFKALKAADEQKDTDLVKKWAIESIHLSNNVLKTAKPSDESDLAVWNTSQAYGKEVKAYAEYALDTAILRTTDPQKRVDLFETLEKESPACQYLPQLYGTALAAYAKMKPDKSFAFAQRAIAKDPNNEDLLLVLAAGAYERKQFDTTVNYANRLVKVMTGHAKPEGVSSSDWEFRRTSMLGRGYWFAGMSYAARNKHPQAAENLKASLPFVKGEPQLVAAAQLTIGLSDYGLARVTREKSVMQEALRYTELAAQSNTAYAKQASQNAYAIKNELAKMR